MTAAACPTLSCYHCGEPVPSGSNYQAVIQGQPQPMCCPGCKAVAETIVSSGLDHFYRHRTETTPSAVINADADLPQALSEELQLYDTDRLQQSFVSQGEGDLREAMLAIEGISCAACVWLLEHHLSKLEGVDQATVNLTNHRAIVRWHQDQVELSSILLAIYRIGYLAHPYRPDVEEQQAAQEKRRAIRRLGIAGVGAMQVMMMAIALYAGALEGIDHNTETLIRWFSLLVISPVVFYAAQPFFKAAVRDLKVRHLTMDVPVSLAIGGAYCASVYATWTRQGEIYFDSVAMFTFFLLIGRYLEMQARHRTGRAGNALLNLIPASATKLIDGETLLVAADELQQGDRVLIKPGHTIPADGRIINGDSSIDESALTGEYLPVQRGPGEAVVAGTMNVEQTLTIEVEKVGANTQLSAIVRLLDRAQSEKPEAAKTADKVASYFVAAVLFTAAVVSLIWYQIAPENAFWITLSVLVVTCPCALSLATPTALTAATGTLRQQGLLITRGHVLESMQQCSDIVFDKTGTLTEGKLSITRVEPLAELERDRLLIIAAALESHSEHPIAQAFSQYAQGAAEQVSNKTGLGLEGMFEGVRYRIGKPRFASGITLAPQTDGDAPDSSCQWLLLADEQRPLAWIGLTDTLRPGCKSLIEQLRAQGLEIHLLTGDSSQAVQQVATELAIENISSDASPEDKLSYIQALQQQGKKVMMVGDGINDIPVLAAAHTSVAMGSATDLAKTSADAVLVNGELARLADAISLARKTQRVIRQNLGWSLVYNIVALPLAAAGFIAPYMAAVGMSASSLVVVGNALRLNRNK